MSSDDFTDPDPESCPHCGASLDQLTVRNYDPVWQDGEVWCTVCNKFVRNWNAG